MYKKEKELVIVKEPQPILKFQRKDDGTFVEISLSDFRWPKGGEGTCPDCGAKLVGTGKDWVCENKECGAEFLGPIF